jgi:hypothetical protein
MLKIPAYLFFVWVTFAAACAQTTELDPDGQTHWMTHCDEDDDCGGLSCICGACTETCESDDACSVQGEGRAVCAVADDVLDADACGGQPGEVRACAPACDRTSDCRAVSDDLVCSNEGACVRGSTGAPELTDPIDGGGSVAAAPVALTCVDGSELTGTGDYEIVGTDIFYKFVVAPDGAIYVTVGGSGIGRIMRIDESGTSIITPELDHIENLLIDGDQLIVADVDGDNAEITIATIDRTTEEVTILARQDGFNVPGLAADTEYIYWTTDRDQFRSTVWRSPRVPDQSEMIGEIAGGSFGSSLTAVGEQLFLLGYPSEGVYPELFRLDKTGTSGVSGPVGDAPAGGMWGMVSDGETLFFLLHRETGRVNTDAGRGSRIARASADMVESETLFELDADQQALLGGQLDDTYVYWMGLKSPDYVDVFSVWRGRKDGSGAPEQLATLDTWVIGMRPENGAVYWISRCESGNSNLVKIPAP